MTKMSAAHEKKPRPPRLPSSSTANHPSNYPSQSHKPVQPPPSSSSSSSIATPPRAALRFKTTSDSQQLQNDTASIKSIETADLAAAADEVQSLFCTQELSLSSLLTEKDGRIAELEAEIRTMEDEFERELTQLSLKLTAESETALFWQQKHSSLHQTYLKSDTELRILRQEFTSSGSGGGGGGSSSSSNAVVSGGVGGGGGGAGSQAQAHAQEKVREERERDIKTRITSLVLDRDAFREAYNEAMGELRGKEELVRELRGQVRGLKAWVSVSGKTTEQVADEAFGEKWRRLGNGLQNWVITGFRRVRIDLDKADEKKKEQLSRLVPTYEALASSSKIHLIQSLVSRLLVDHVFNAYFVGLTKEHAEELRKVEKHLGSFGSAESLNAWRSATLMIFQKEAPAKLQSETNSVIETIVHRLNSLMDTIGDLPHNEVRDASLRTLISSAIELSRLLRVQKAVFSVTMPSIEPHQRTVFDVESMEDIGGEDEDMLGEREISCVTFPGMVKSGDENGERGHLRNVVAKIKVLCAPD